MRVESYNQNLRVSYKRVSYLPSELQSVVDHLTLLSRSVLLSDPGHGQGDGLYAGLLVPGAQQPQVLPLAPHGLLQLSLATPPRPPGPGHVRRQQRHHDDHTLQCLVKEICLIIADVDGPESVLTLERGAPSGAEATNIKTISVLSLLLGLLRKQP